MAYTTVTSSTHALIFEGLVPSAPPTIEMLLILTSVVNLSKAIGRTILNEPI